MTLQLIYCRSNGWSLMNTMAITRRVVIPSVLTCVFSSLLAAEVSVPEPTKLHVVASTEGSNVVWSELLGEIESADASAAVTVIDIEGSNAKRARGVLIELKNAASTDHVYVTDDLLPSLRKELQELELNLQYAGECEAKHQCVLGIARCRPSQTKRQAYCPGFYSTAESDGGFILSTPRNTFLFPSIRAAQFDSFISEAVQVFIANEAPDHGVDEPSVDILGVKIKRGMRENRDPE
ncbi:hypothetical protein [Parahaliea mediterranea]|uniref:Uncharacterized protein n=1 Tax=Parahaliea mediterranea TaxID=651086 RepID=A0A939DEN3_9GAMM|nr:hypothetical protein [Parahaliea mediterranea]MBN7796880.1 hypothetical protein [Parahaliea mediterranea]